MTRKKVTIHTLVEKQCKREKVVLLTAYDYPTAKIADAAGVDVLLVGDSGGMALLGHTSTVEVTMEEMLVLAAAVGRAKPTALVIGDMPFLSYQVCEAEAVRNAGRFMQVGCDAVKCEGGVRMAPRIRAMVDAGIAVMGHIGLTPQNAAQLGGYRVQGRTLASFKALVADALALQDAGVFAILLEAMPEAVAKALSAHVRVPCYGIGAGVHVDGQLVIVHDMLGLFMGEVQPRFVKRYMQGADMVAQAIGSYCGEVREQAFPRESHCYSIDAGELEKIRAFTPE
jgi:3-methyl-2-oxobutanoate hydroxymethyltransferase